ncbi:MAG TPA: bacillithiol biosynthesis BshC [Thermoanaerobaculia bacterium]|nr:bacillithiol biosynthesis BshC [Thermoanaerobaculia bacterium]
MTLQFPLAAYPGFNRFVLDWLGGDARFLCRGTTPVGAHGVRPQELADALIESNKRWGLFVGDDVKRWQNGEGVTVIAGQQTGFAGGPLYTLVKIATLLRMKRDNEARGIPTTVFFWLATEDHDFAEVASIAFPSGDARAQRDLVYLRAARAVETRDVVGPQPVPPVLVDELLAFFDMPRPSWLREGISFRDSFAELIASVFPRDVVLVDALLPELRRAGAPLFEAIFEKRDAIQHALATRAAELEQAGYTPQVAPRENGQYTLLYAIDDRGNRDITEIPVEPERTSTSALSRPLLQAAVLQPDVFVGGPAEVAYYAQIAPLHEMLGLAMPRVALRAHALVAPKRICRAFGRYDIKPEEIFTSAEELLADREPQGVAKIRDAAERGRKQLAEVFTEIGDVALPADHAIARRVSRSIGHIEYHFDKLAERATRALVHKDRERYAAARELVATLFPDRHVQDRIVGWFAQWNESGDHLIERLIEEIEPDSDVCRIVTL